MVAFVLYVPKIHFGMKLVKNAKLVKVGRNSSMESVSVPLGLIGMITIVLLATCLNSSTRIKSSVSSVKIK